jgi:hypothetical protein
MKWNPNLTPQHVVFEAVELVNELDLAQAAPPAGVPEYPGSLFVPKGMSEQQAIEAARKGHPPKPADQPPVQ